MAYLIYGLAFLGGLAVLGLIGMLFQQEEYED